MTVLEFSCHSTSVGNLAGPILVIFIANARTDIKLFKNYKLNFVVLIVSKLAHFQNQEKNLLIYAKSPEVPLQST